jgi:hypothetical protein
MSMADIVAAFATNYPSATEPIFGQLCLVYPRPRVRDAGK